VSDSQDDRMGSVFIMSRKPTGRGFGDKVPEKTTSLTLEGVKVTATAWDAWEGPCAPHERGEYHRIVSIGRPA